MRLGYSALIILCLVDSQPVVAQRNPEAETCDVLPGSVTLAQKEQQENQESEIAGGAIAFGSAWSAIAQPTALVPSLWWAKAQFDPFDGQLITTWIAHPQHRQIALIVNRQLWSRLDYVQRYRFMHQFGTVARNYQYNLSVFNQQQKCLATYTCTYQTDPDQCQINLDPFERPGLLVVPMEGNREWGTDTHAPRAEAKREEHRGNRQ